MLRNFVVRNFVFSRPAKVAPLLALAAALGLCGCHGKATVAPPPTTTATSVAPTTSTMPTTTIYQPSAPLATKEAAAAHLIAAWQAGSQATALTDASPTAVTAVFAQPFPAGGVQSRGCSNPPAGPATCTYRIFANGNLVELFASQVTGGWVTSDAKIES